MIELPDDAQRTIRLDGPARRIVSLVPSLTETLFGLGVGAAVIGITRYCVEPSQAVAAITKVGGTKNPDVERIRVLAPDLVLVNTEENRRADFEALERAGLTVFVSFPRRVRDVVRLLHQLGALTGSAEMAARLAAELSAAVARIERQPPRLRRRVFCPIWKNPWMSFNADTYADDLLRLAGGDNVCTARAQRYCTVTLEEIAATDPEVILLPDEPYVFSRKDLPSLAPLAATSAGRARRISCIDGKALSWYGPRTAPALAYLQRVIAG